MTRLRCRVARRSVPLGDLTSSTEPIRQYRTCYQNQQLDQFVPLHRARASHGEYTIDCLNLAADLSTVYDRLATTADNRGTSLRYRPLPIRLQIPSLQTFGRCRLIRIVDARIHC